MPLEEGIVAWSEHRPSWQRVVLRRVADGQHLSEDALDQLVDAVVAGTGPPQEELEIGNLLASSGAQTPSVSLESVSEPNHVNALSTTAPLTFARRGLTVVYGDNGSGKSGYARLLKRIARSRHHEEVLTNVFRDTSVDQPTAKLGVHIGEELHQINWPDSARIEVQRMLFYDSGCGTAYIADEADFPYRPYALFVMDGLIEACSKVSKLVDTKLSRNARAAVDLPRPVDASSQAAAAQFLVGLSARSTIEDLDALIDKLDAPEMSITAALSEEETLRSADTRQARHNLERTAERLESLAAHIGRVDLVLGPEGIREVGRVRGELAQIKEAAEQHAEWLRSEALPGVGSPAWKVLWESAKRFSENDAYADQPFPVSTEDSRCVLCLQLLRKPGSDVLSRLDQFVQDDIQIRRDQAESEYLALIEAGKSQQVFGGAVRSHLRDLEASHPDDVDVVKALLGHYEAAQAGEAAGDAATPGGGVVVARLQEVASKSRKLAEDMADPALIQRRLQEAVEKRREIELLIETKGARDQIVKEIERLGTRKRLEDLKQEANTGPITRKILELSEEAITEMVRDRFTRETDRLDLERVTIAKTKARKGALLHQPKLVGARQSSEVSRIFSEGERSALGLAACFAEASLDESGSALILDDPVTSLDHIRRERVAERLAAFSETRQVVVFTHDVAFVANLKGAALRKDVPVTERWVSKSRSGERLPGSCVDTHPWKAKDVRARLGELREDLAKIRKHSEDIDDQLYEEVVASWAGKLSETWERVFSQEVVGQVLADGGMEVRPMMVRILARFTNDDYLEFDGSYARASRWARRHDKSTHLNYVAPQLSELEEELALIDQWFNRVRKYK